MDLIIGSSSHKIARCQEDVLTHLSPVLELRIPSMTTLKPASQEYPGSSGTGWETERGPSVGQLMSRLEKMTITSNGLVERYDTTTHTGIVEVADW